MTQFQAIDRLPTADRVKAYADLAAHLRSMAALAHGDATKLTFLEMAKEMDERAGAVIEFAA